MSQSETPVGGWPDLPSDQWADTLEALHLWSQIVGKIRLVQAPWVNHSWGVTLQVSPSGLRTGLVPHGSEAFEWTIDVLASSMDLVTTTGQRRSVDLGPRPVADVHAEVLDAMASVGMPVRIHPVPSEIADATPFPDDTTTRRYDPDHAAALWRGLVQAERVLTRFRAGFQGKASPVHLFWGSLDLAVTRFSGRTAPPHPGGLPNFPVEVAREAYSHEVTSAGFWPGNRQSPTPVFYAYAYPTPDGLSDVRVAPDAAAWVEELGEFVLPYDAVAGDADPDATLLAFLESTHAAAADLAHWDRDALECARPQGPDWWRDRIGHRVLPGGAATS